MVVTSLTDVLYACGESSVKPAWLICMTIDVTI